MNKRHINYVLLTIFSLIFLTSCGGEKKKEEKKEPMKIGVQKEEEPKAEVDNNITEIVITANDMMQFNLSEIKVKAGQKVKVTLRHIGKLDVNVMGHNFVILKKGVDLVDFATKAATFKSNDYIPEGTDDVIAHTDLIGGGQTTTIEFDAPEVGTYDFLCSFPGHYAMMKGKFIVE